MACPNPFSSPTPRPHNNVRRKSQRGAGLLHRKGAEPGWDPVRALTPSPRGDPQRASPRARNGGAPAPPSRPQLSTLSGAYPHPAYILLPDLTQPWCLLLHHPRLGRGPRCQLQCPPDAHPASCQPHGSTLTRSSPCWRCCQSPRRWVQRGARSSPRVLAPLHSPAQAGSVRGMRGGSVAAPAGAPPLARTRPPFFSRCKPAKHAACSRRGKRQRQQMPRGRAQLPANSKRSPCPPRAGPLAGWRLLP